MEHVVIAIPTINSSNYIANALGRICEEVRLVPPEYQCSIFVGLNGPDPQDATKKSIEKFASDHPTANIELVRIEQPGKNSALNALIAAAKARDAHIIHFFDDDVALKKGSLGRNLQALSKAQAEHEFPVLVGSRFLSRKYDFDHFRRTRTVWGALVPWLLHRTFSISFLPGSDEPKVCSGVSMGAYLEWLPRLPSDDLGVADDAFWDNHYAIGGKREFEQEGLDPVLKPQDSIAYFDLPVGLGEWFTQQVRTYIGVKNAYDCFPEDGEFLARYFRWPFSLVPPFRCAPSGLRGRDIPFYFTFRAARAAVATVGERKRKHTRTLSWETASSTKF